MSLEHFIGAYSFINEIKGNISLIPKICERELTEVEQKLSLAENAHKQAAPMMPSRVKEEPQTDWINKKAVPKVALTNQNQGPISIKELDGGFDLSSDDD